MPSAVKIMSQLVQQSKRHFEYTDPATGRLFSVCLVECECPRSLKFFLAECIPCGTRRVANAIGASEIVADARIALAEIEGGPNDLFRLLEAQGIPAAQVMRVAPGLDAGSVLHNTLEDCAACIASSLQNNRWYHAKTASEVTQQKVRQGHLGHQRELAYWNREQSMLQQSEHSLPGLFKGCYSLLGPLSREAQREVLAYFNKPTLEAWKDVRRIIVVGPDTLWDAWCRLDATAPTQESDRYPNGDTLKVALREAVAHRKTEIAEKLEALEKDSLRVLA